jgi:hypothetical protein
VPGTRTPRSGCRGARSIRRSRALNCSFQLGVTGRHAWGPCGLRVTSRGNCCRDGADSRRLAAVQTVSCSPERARRAQWATTHDTFSWKKARAGPGGLRSFAADPEVVRNRFLELRQRHRSGGVGGTEPASVAESGFGLKRRQVWTTWKHSAVRGGPPGGDFASTPSRRTEAR